MEKLTAAQQQNVKMSDERLRLKLVAGGYEEDVVVAMERETTLSTYAEFLASGGVRPGAAPQVGYDPDVEAQKLAFEKQRWESEREDKLRREEVEREERKAEREEKLRKEEDKLRKEEAEQRRWEAEQRRWEADREERQSKELVEDERRQTEMQQQAELFAQRQRELDRQTARDRAEEARRDSTIYAVMYNVLSSLATCGRLGAATIAAGVFVCHA